MPALFSRHPAVRAADIRESLEHDGRPVYSESRLRALAKQRGRERERRARIVSVAVAGALPLPPHAVVAFTVSDDPASVASLERHVADIDVVVPDWFSFSGPGCDLEEHVDETTQRVLGRAHALVMPRLANLTGDAWRGETVAELLRDDVARRCLVDRLVTRLSALHADGLNLDVEELQPEDSEPLLDLLVDLRAALHSHALRLTVDVPLHDPAFDDEFIGEVADAVFVMAYDEHYPLSRPGAVASRDWFVDSIDEVRARVPADRIVVVLGAYGYDWHIGSQQPAESVSFRAAMANARAAGANPRFELDQENVHFGYRDEDGALHDVWVEDALATWNQMQALRERGLDRVGLWRLGTEDETLWSFLRAGVGTTIPPSLRTIAVSRTVDLIGHGEVLSIASEPQRGDRELSVEPDGHINSAEHTSVPSGWIVERRGSQAPKELVLTFDDGPDATWTPEILAVLSELHVPATFFVVGDQAARFPDIVQDEVAAGHLIGNHTYTHPHMERLTPREASVELGATERLIEGLTGTRTSLLRLPYTSNVDPDLPDEMLPMRGPVASGYVLVGAGVDSEDWQRRGVDWTAQHVVDEVVHGAGQIVLMHDAGGDRRQTVAALRKLVPGLQRRGYHFVSLDHWLRVPRSEIAASLPLNDRILAWGSMSIARARSWGWIVLALLFFVCTMLSIGRILMLGALTLRQARALPVVAPPDFDPLVTVLVPAYNEAKVLARTIEAILASEWRNLEVVVIDDGSTDDTASIAEAIALGEPRVRRVRQEHAGKAAAANHGLSMARGEIVVAVDADTLIEHADLTLTLLRAGGRVAYEPDARARTEAPETLAALLHQRFRWTYGTYQCIWKHRRAFGHGSLGWVGLPNRVLFQLIFPALSPIGDLVMVLSIFRGDWRAFLAGYLAFLVMDLCGSVLAFVLDGKPLRWLGLLLVQRFSYPQLMYYVSFRAVVAALRGARHGWRKLERTGSVSTMPAPGEQPAHLGV